MNELMSKLGDQQAKYNFQGTIAFIIMKSLQRTAQTSARAPEDAAGCPSAALQFMLSRGCNYRLHYWISLWKSAIAPQIITPIHGGGLRSAQREWPRGRRIGGTLRRVTRWLHVQKFTEDSIWRCSMWHNAIGSWQLAKPKRALKSVLTSLRLDSANCKAHFRAAECFAKLKFWEYAWTLVDTAVRGRH